MADVLDQIQQEQSRETNAELARARHDYNWNSTFGRIAPDNVLREARNMTALINTAIERKMALAAQTSEEAQRIFVNDQKFKAWEKQQPLRDDLLRAQIADEEASEGARTAQELLARSRDRRAKLSEEQSALAQWEMDELESSSLPEAEKRAWLNTVRGRYPSMDKDTSARHKSLHGVFNPDPAQLTPDEKIAQAVKLTAATTATRNALNASAKPTPETPDEKIARIEAESKARAAGTAAGKPDAAESDNYRRLDLERAAAVKEYARFRPESEKENENWLPGDVQKVYDERRSAIRAQGNGAPAAPASTASTPTHPMEGQIVKQKSTGKTGRIVSGQFVEQ